MIYVYIRRIFLLLALFPSVLFAMTPPEYIAEVDRLLASIQEKIGKHSHNIVTRTPAEGKMALCVRGAKLAFSLKTPLSSLDMAVEEVDRKCNVVLKAVFYRFLLEEVPANANEPGAFTEYARDKKNLREWDFHMEPYTEPRHKWYFPLVKKISMAMGEDDNWGGLYNNEGFLSLARDVWMLHHLMAAKEHSNPEGFAKQKMEGLSFLIQDAALNTIANVMEAYSNKRMGEVHVPGSYGDGQPIFPSGISDQWANAISHLKLYINFLRQKAPFKAFLATEREKAQRRQPGLFQNLFLQVSPVTPGMHFQDQADLWDQDFRALATYEGDPIEKKDANMRLEKNLFFGAFSRRIYAYMEEPSFRAYGAAFPVSQTKEELFESRWLYRKMGDFILGETTKDLLSHAPKNANGLLSPGQARSVVEAFMTWHEEVKRDLHGAWMPDMSEKDWEATFFPKDDGATEQFSEGMKQLFTMHYYFLALPNLASFRLSTLSGTMGNFVRLEGVDDPRKHSSSVVDVDKELPQRPYRVFFQIFPGFQLDDSAVKIDVMPWPLAPEHAGH